jgi:hypothetical protein
MRPTHIITGPTAVSQYADVSMEFVGLKVFPRRKCMNLAATICETEDGRRLYVEDGALAELDEHGNAKPDPKTKECPKCGEKFDPSEHSIYECPRCNLPGSTACCNPGGNHCICAQCEEEM